MNIEETLKTIPSRPGVYIFKDRQGKVIYVGKAKSLKNRVRSYFISSNNSVKNEAIRNKLNDIEYIVTDTEVEALILECNLIKRHRPRYNVLLKDDKNYPYIKVTTDERFPRILIVRKMKNDKAKYFGPYTDMGAVKDTVKLIRRIFPVRNCKKSLEKVPLQERECLNYHIKRCGGPCQGYIDEERYNSHIKDVIMFLNGRYDVLENRLVSEMEKAAEIQDFERAAELRDQVLAVQKMMEQQKIVSSEMIDQDVIGCAGDDSNMCAAVFFVRKGKLVGKETFFLTGTGTHELKDILGSFVKQFYASTTFIPREIILQDEIEDMELIGEWLSEKKGSRVNIKTPRRGEKRKLLEMVIQNARINLEHRISSIEKEREKNNIALEELKNWLDLDDIPYRIEAFDISNIQGHEPVASMVVFEGGEPKNRDYRRFKIKTVSGPDDFASIKEVVYRRFKRGLEERIFLKEQGINDKEGKFSTFPDLILIDGGKGQLNAAEESLKELGLKYIPAIGIAKEFEHIFLPGKSGPLILPSNSPALHLIQRIRDEAHRFAVTFHRDLRGKRNLKSILDEIPGIGKVRKKALLKAFGSVKRIREASIEELKKVKGMNKKTAETVYEFFH